MLDDSTRRFSNRVADYIKYRPSYPPGLLDLLREECGFDAGSIVADLGSGTGILSEIWLRNGNKVFGVEPNPDMRAAGERLLAAYHRFVSADATAEATTLPDASIGFVTAGQAFHWFDRPAARREFARILEPGGWVVLVWNERRLDSTPFLRQYEALLQEYGTDYAAVRSQDLDLPQAREFAGTDEVKLTILDNTQSLDFEGVKGRLLSSSYAPAAGHPVHAAMLARLEVIFSEHQNAGRIDFEYETKVYYFRLPGQS